MALRVFGWRVLLHQDGEQLVRYVLIHHAMGIFAEGVGTTDMAAALAAKEHADRRVAALRAGTPAPATRKPGMCCPMRVKIALAPTVLTEEQCGVADVAMTDFMRFDLDMKRPDGSPCPVLQVKFCPWCGASLPITGTFRVVTYHDPQADEGEEWKGEGEEDDCDPEA